MNSPPSACLPERTLGMIGTHGNSAWVAEGRGVGQTGFLGKERISSQFALLSVTGCGGQRSVDHDYGELWLVHRVCTFSPLTACKRV